MTQFDRFDADGDGRITFEELKSGFAIMGVPQTDEEIRQMIREADVEEQDGAISLEEYLLVLGHGNPKAQELTHTVGGARAWVL